MRTRCVRSVMRLVSSLGLCPKAPPGRTVASIAPRLQEAPAGAVKPSATGILRDLYQSVKHQLRQRADQLGLSARDEATLLDEWHALLDSESQAAPQKLLAQPVHDLINAARRRPGVIVQVFRSSSQSIVNAFLAGSLQAEAEPQRYHPPAFDLFAAMRRHNTEKADLYGVLTIDRVHELTLHARAGLIQALHREGVRIRRGRRDATAVEAAARVLLATSGHDLTRLKRALMLQRGRNDLVRLVFNDLGSTTLRARVLQHVAVQSDRLRRAEPAQLVSSGNDQDDSAPIHVLSDYDDTIQQGWMDKRYPPGSVFPGVLAFLEALRTRRAGVRGGAGTGAGAASLPASAKRIYGEADRIEAIRVGNRFNGEPSEACKGTSSEGAGDAQRVAATAPHDATEYLRLDRHAVEAGPSLRLPTLQPSSLRLQREILGEDGAYDAQQLSSTSAPSGHPDGLGVEKPDHRNDSIVHQGSQPGEDTRSRRGTMAAIQEAVGGMSSNRLVPGATALWQAAVFGMSQAKDSLRAAAAVRVRVQQKVGRIRGSNGSGRPSETTELGNTTGHVTEQAAPEQEATDSDTGSPSDEDSHIVTDTSATSAEDEEAAMQHLSALVFAPDAGAGAGADAATASPTAKVAAHGASAAAEPAMGCEDRGDLTVITARPAGINGLVKRVTTAKIAALGIPKSAVLCGSLLHATSHAAIARKKIENAERTLLLFPEDEFVFLGDSGQADALVASHLLREHKDRVRGAFIHDVRPGPLAGDGQAKAWHRGNGVIFFDTYAGAAAEAFRLGLLDEAACRGVAEAALRDLEVLLSSAAVSRDASGGAGSSLRLDDASESIDSRHGIESDAPAASDHHQVESLNEEWRHERARSQATARRAAGADSVLAAAAAQLAEDATRAGLHVRDVSLWQKRVAGRAAADPKEPHATGLKSLDSVPQ